jgi:hypothetical protein
MKSNLFFFNSISNTPLSDTYAIYIHEGGDATYTLPDSITRSGKSWKIINIGRGSITTDLPFTKEILPEIRSLINQELTVTPYFRTE